MLQRLSKNGKRTIAIRITTNFIRELTERLDKLINQSSKYHIKRNLICISEILINGWTIMKNLTERKREDNIAPATMLQYNQARIDPDLSSDWKLQQTQDWKNSEHSGYDTEEILREEGSTEKVLVEETEQVEQVIEEDISEMIGRDGIIMTRGKCTTLQKAWKEFIRTGNQ